MSAAQLEVPEEAADDEAPADDAALADLISELDLGSSGISSVLWANGYRPDFRWIGLRVFDGDGWPLHERGVTASRGLNFVGLHWLYKRKSALFLGVGDDAAYLADHIHGAAPSSSAFAKRER